jgi:hypothetical protein
LCRASPRLGKSLPQTLDLRKRGHAGWPPIAQRLPGNTDLEKTKEPPEPGLHRRRSRHKHAPEELAGIIWRKRRLRQAEAAAHHRALKRTTDPYQGTAKAALIHVAAHDETESVDDAIRATEEQTAEWTCFGKVESSPMSNEELDDAAATVYERI